MRKIFDIISKNQKFNYHIVKSEIENGFLIYIKDNDVENSIEKLEFTPTIIAETFISNNDLKIEKVAPSIFFIDNINIDELKNKLNINLFESNEFSIFIESIKNNYRKLEIEDFILYKKDSKSYDENKKKEYSKNQKRLLDRLLDQLKIDSDSESEIKSI